MQREDECCVVDSVQVRLQEQGCLGLCMLHSCCCANIGCCVCVDVVLLHQACLAPLWLLLFAQVFIVIDKLACTVPRLFAHPVCARRLLLFVPYCALDSSSSLLYLGHLPCLHLPHFRDARDAVVGKVTTDRNNCGKPGRSHTSTKT